jgi:hypothetical protein
MQVTDLEPIAEAGIAGSTASAVAPATDNAIIVLTKRFFTTMASLPS